MSDGDLHELNVELSAIHAEARAADSCRMAEGLRSGLLTVDEYRRIVGMPPLYPKAAAAPDRLMFWLTFLQGFGLGAFCYTLVLLLAKAVWP